MEELRIRTQKKRLTQFCALTLLSVTLAFGQGTKITPPENRFEKAEDVKLGQEAAAQVQKELPLLPENGDVDDYVERVGTRLVAAIPQEFHHAEFRYQFSVVNASDINAFALPGGPMFVNRGMIEAAKTEGEMAGVMAHEISHVALRHGTAQASKTQKPLVQIGAIGGAILGAVIGGNAGDIVAQGTQIGLGAYLMKYSREYETQADILGAQIMARAGYDPMDLARMFQTIEKEGGGRGPEWLSSHPNPGNRQARIQEESKKLSISPQNNGNSADFTNIQQSLRRMPPAPTMEEAVRKSAGGSNGGSGSRDEGIQPNVGAPSNRYRTYEAPSVVRLSVPDNWREFSSQSSVTFAPEGAYGTHQQQSVFTHGAMIGFVNINNNQNLRQATDQYINQLLQGNSYLRTSGNYQQTRLDGRQALARRLAGTSNVTGQRELVTVYTTLLQNGALFYIIQVVPEAQASTYSRAFSEMVRSTRLAG